MKVVHVTPYFPPHLGGLQQSVKNLATAQSKNGLEVTVITSNKPKVLSKNNTNSFVKVIRLKTLDIGHTPIMPFLLFELLWRVRKEDVVHVHFAQFYVSEVVALFSKLTGHPFVFHYHGDVLATGSLGKLLPFYKTHIVRRSLKQASVIVYPSEDFKNHTFKQFSFLKDKKNFVVPNGIELPKIDSINSLNTNKFLTASRLSKVKNIGVMVEAFVEARNEASDIELYIAGQGDEELALKNLVNRLQANSYIHFLGNLQQSELKKHYMNSSVFLATAKWETFGLSIAEAMSYGLPVIAFDAPAVRELVKNNYSGLLVHGFNKHKFANEIARLANHPKMREKLSINALTCVAVFDYQKVAKEYESIYKEAMGNPHNSKTY
jgi:glycosyltransferase involved in cell wall biosynthesis